MLKSFLQDLVIVLALILGLRFTGITLEWYHIVMIIAAVCIYGGKNYYEGMAYGRAHAAFLTPEDFDKWLKSHNLTPAEYTKAKSDESH